MLQLHQFELVNGKNVSPFCLKVETYCRLAEIPYQPVPSMPQKAPRGKLPYITDRGKVVADSGLIVDYLKQTYGDPLDGALSDEQRAHGHLLRRVCEESLFFVIGYSRWLDDDFWPLLKAAFFGKLPPLVREIVPALVRKHIRKTLYAQGYGRHSKEQVYALGAADLAAIATYLEQTRFAVSNEPTSFDATVYAFLANVLDGPANSPLTQEAAKHAVLTDYVGRMKARLGPSL